ncbi:MAG: hypothetical protein EA425_13275 [Puniceicoccaceae bacterium]|nr:MAG: hypothetical protein EA425_13275 [Puniceicoccaceae bacterium]
MHVTGLALTPPPGAENNPRVTPELLASVLARYSRSNEGLGTILSRIDPADPEASIDRILRFVDYGHASIGGLTGGIAIAVDDISMWLAYKLFEIAQMADGQESSTRYIRLEPAGLPEPSELGLDGDLAVEWQAVMAAAFTAYESAAAALETLGRNEPERLRLPDSANPAVRNRLRKNFALDRARYFIPLATRTNLALVMSARMWAQTVRHLDSLPQVEARRAAAVLREELMKFSPRLMRHSTAEASFEKQALLDHETSLELGRQRLSTENLADEVWVKVDAEAPTFLPERQTVAEALRHRGNRYGWCGTAIRRMRVTFAWNNLAVAELRDLNRHRTGHRHTPLIQAGFYLPPEVDPAPHAALLERQQRLLRRLLEAGHPGTVYGLLLGSQTPFEHSTHADKFIYEAELRTGMGAHFRYAEHLSAALRAFYAQVPEAREWVSEGTAEPE